MTDFDKLFLVLTFSFPFTCGYILWVSIMNASDTHARLDAIERKLFGKTIKELDDRTP